MFWRLSRVKCCQRCRGGPHLVPTPLVEETERKIKNADDFITHLTELLEQGLVDKSKTSFQRAIENVKRESSQRTPIGIGLPAPHNLYFDSRVPGPRVPTVGTSGGDQRLPIIFFSQDNSENAKSADMLADAMTDIAMESFRVVLFKHPRERLDGNEFKHKQLCLEQSGVSVTVPERSEKLSDFYTAPIIVTEYSNSGYVSALARKWVIYILQEEDACTPLPLRMNLPNAKRVRSTDDLKVILTEALANHHGGDDWDTIPLPETRTTALLEVLGDLEGKSN